MNGGVDLRVDPIVVKDQGRRGTCVACAATAAHELVRNGGTELCIEYLHWSAKRRDGLPAVSEGTTLLAVSEALNQDGQPPETTWPYDHTRDQWAADYQPPQCAIDEAGLRRINGGTELVPDAASVRDALDRSQPVVLGVRLHSTWFDAGPDGQIALPAAGQVDFGGHAVLVVGYRNTDLIVQNSWGRDWGDGGIAYLPDEYVNRFGIAAWSVAL